MREDIESNMGYSKMIEVVRKKFKEEGRDFEKEYNEFLKIGNKEENKE